MMVTQNIIPSDIEAILVYITPIYDACTMKFPNSVFYKIHLVIKCVKEHVCCCVIHTSYTSLLTNITGITSVGHLSKGANMSTSLKIT